MDNIRDLIQAVTKFRDDRDWKQFHTFKDLSAALAIEASELQELTLWKSESEIEARQSDPDFREAFCDELADVFAYLLLMADKSQVDLGKALANKIKKNEAKYPIHKAKGNAQKYTDYE